MDSLDYGTRWDDHDHVFVHDYESEDRWCTRDGRLLHESEMSTNHLHNAHRLIKSKNSSSQWVRRFADEIEKRKLESVAASTPVEDEPLTKPTPVSAGHVWWLFCQWIMQPLTIRWLASLERRILNR